MGKYIVCKKFAAGMTLAMLLAQAPAMAADKPAGSTVIAKAGSRSISVDDLSVYVASLDQRTRAALAQDPDGAVRVVRSLAARELLLKEALSKSWDKKPQVAATLEKLRENAIIDTYLNSVSQPPKDFPSDAEIAKVYEANKKSFLAPRQYRIAQIYIALPANAGAAAKDTATAKLSSVEKKLKAKSADFGAIAADSSDEADASRKQSEARWLPENQIRPEIRSALAGLGKGEVSDPIQLDDGWHIIRLIDTKPASIRSLDEMHDALRDDIRQQKAMALAQEYLAGVLEKTPPKIDEAALAKAVGADRQPVAQ